MDENQVKWDELLILIAEITGISVLYLEKRILKYGITNWKTLNDYLDIITASRDSG